MSLAKDLEILLNRRCEENTSNTPDFVLAEFLSTCLKAWNTATQQRDKWYNINPQPGRD